MCVRERESVCVCVCNLPAAFLGLVSKAALLRQGRGGGRVTKECWRHLILVSAEGDIRQAAWIPVFSSPCVFVVEEKAIVWTEH